MTHNRLMIPFGEYEKIRSLRFTGEYFRESKYILMRDSIKIAVDILLPIELKNNSIKLPILLYQTRYWRRMERKPLFKWIEPDEHPIFKILISLGFGLVWGDMRGTGASLGSREFVYCTPKDINDSFDLIEWIIHQPFSNGDVLAWGNSIAGTSAEVAAISNHPALKGIVPRADEFDSYTDLAFSGGLFSEKFFELWHNSNDYLDRNICSLKYLGPIALLSKGVAPVDDDREKLVLKQAILDHKANIDIYSFGKDIIFRDDFPATHQIKMNDYSIHTYLDKLQNWMNFGGKISHWGSWMDAWTADVTIKHFLNLNGSMRCVIGSWNHPTRLEGDPFENHKKPGLLAYRQLLFEWVRFFDYCIEESTDTGIANEKTLIYYTMGEKKWKSTHDWPLPETQYIRFYLQNNNYLSEKFLSFDSTTQEKDRYSAYDTYKINYTTTTGKTNRWKTQTTGCSIDLGERSHMDTKMLIYTTDPLKEDMEITGHPSVQLFLSTTHQDGIIIVYIEIVNPHGKSWYLTEGQLRFLHRKKVSPPYKTIGPYNSFEKKDALSVIPNEIMELPIRIIPTSILIPKGYRIRLAIAGADQDNFDRYPKEGNPIITVFRGEQCCSYLELPIIPRY